MKTLRIFALFICSLISFSSAHAQCVLSCYADFNLTLDASGHATITPEDVLGSYGPDCGTLVVAPSSFDCSDIGAPIQFTVTDLSSGNACTGNIHVQYAASVMACYGDINVELGPSGEMTLTPEMLLVEPSVDCIPDAIITPSTVSCADIGEPVVVLIIDPVSGNSCWTNVTVTYEVGAMSCNAYINVQLDPSGSLALTPEMILYDPPGACIPGAIISPASVNCMNIGEPVVVTITDPVGGNACWSTVTVDDPRPTDCEIIVPNSILCGDSGIPFSVYVTGGYGPFEYEWEIKGNPHGWSILSGQGTDNIIMEAGDRMIKLEVTITDICGKKRKCSVKPDCDDPSAFGEFEPDPTPISDREKSIDLIELFPNPVIHNLWVKYPDWISTETGQLYVVDQIGQVHVKARSEQNRFGRQSLDVQDLPPGIFWLIIEDSDHEPMVTKFIKL